MRNYAKRLIADFTLQEQQQERLDSFALAMLPNLAEETASLNHSRPLAIPTEEGWTAALWVPLAGSEYSGLIRTVQQHCRSRKLALITANYYRLHHLINAGGTANSSNTSPSY